MNDGTLSIFPDEKLLALAKNHMKNGQIHNIWKQKHNSLPMKGYSSKLSKWFRDKSHSNVKKLEDRKDDTSKNLQSYRKDQLSHRNFSKLLGNVLN